MGINYSFFFLVVEFTKDLSKKKIRKKSLTDDQHSLYFSYDFVDLQ
jgi:hypothetical protein